MTLGNSWPGRHASGADLRADLSAGLTTAVMLVPQGMAYAMLAGLDPIVGLYASTLPLALYALFGSSRTLAVGPVAMDSLMVAAGLLPLVHGDAVSYAAHAAVLALMVGAIQMGMGALRLGFLVRVLNQPVIVGFTAAAALIIGVSQLKAAVGIDLPRSQQVHVILLAAAQRLGDIHPLTLAVSVTCVVTLLLLKSKAPRFPRFLLVVAVGILVTRGFGLDRAGLAIVGDVPAGLPGLSVPRVSLSAVGDMVPLAIAIALVGMMEALSIAKRYADDVVPNRELTSLGLANLGAGVVGGYPVTGGFSRTAVNAEAGARTPLAGLVTAGSIVVTLLFLTDLFTFLPLAVLAAIIMTAVAGLIDVATLRRLWRESRPDFTVAMITFAATLTLGIQLGMATGLAARFAVFIGITALGCTPKTDRIAPAALAAGLQANPSAYHVVDVRTGLEFNGSGGHIAGAVSRPYPGVLWSADQLTPSAGQTVVLICLTGHRSRFPLDAVRKSHPDTTVVDLEGGMRAWWALELPTEVSSD